MDIKQVIVYRRDLNMRKGKIAAQVAHASMKVFFDRGRPHVSRDPTGKLPDDHWLDILLTPDMATWVDGLFAKIVLSVETEADLLRVHDLALEAGIPTALITDAGRTEFKTPCPTCDGGKRVSQFIKDDPMRLGCLVCGDEGKVSVPTRTTVALGPARAEDIDRITGPGGAVPTKLA